MKLYLVATIMLPLIFSRASLAQINTNASTSILITNLVDVLPHVEQFLKTLDLDIPQPLTTNAVKKFHPYRGSGRGVGIELTNKMAFAFDVKHNLIDSFWDGKHVSGDLPAESTKQLRNASTISKDEALNLARKYLTRLGYSEDKSTVLSPRITQDKWERVGDSPDPLPFFTVEWPWKLHPEAEYFSMEIDGTRLKVSKFHTMRGSVAEEGELEALSKRK